MASCWNLLKGLRDMGNTVLVVEHDEDAIRTADHVIDMGPGAGVHGGHIIAEGTPAEIIANKKSLTGKYLSGAENIPDPAPAPQGGAQSLAESGGRARQQSQECHGADSAGHADLHHRRVRRRQIHPHHRDAVQGRRRASWPRRANIPRRMTASKAWNSWTR